MIALTSRGMGRIGPDPRTRLAERGRSGKPFINPGEVAAGCRFVPLRSASSRRDRRRVASVTRPEP
jgi:hypothetical protein